ncbi:hypothetical protein CBOM_08129 [Ceraceosorus bombacis]|uniref:Uncharacterized protein n=1 Tax=Ceraceosorus bombacis TaxID=401625 RepID=A0A0P1B8E5_9BASI|nr:hypothetical protein CBOM_08129 [Ceraceosorus bombacis]
MGQSSAAHRHLFAHSQSQRASVERSGAWIRFRHVMPRRRGSPSHRAFGLLPAQTSANDRYARLVSSLRNCVRLL